ncbi:MAG TPA: DUF882 domain-containing protein [Burkholderiaceae bacterium]|nr:DUF882 domain-containing protein [Burkholderiaceae bacterium]
MQHPTDADEADISCRARRRWLGAGAVGLGALLCGCASRRAPIARLPQSAPPARAARGGGLPDLFDASLLDPDFWVKPRTLDLVRPQTNERVNVLYWADGHLWPDGYDRLCHLLRDVQANRSTRIDAELLDTLWAAQAFVGRYGIRQPLEVLSGYRTPATNRRAGAVSGSLHTEGRAADFRMSGIHPQVLGELVRGLRSGGVGFYHRESPSGGWIHVDTGGERSWAG